MGIGDFFDVLDQCTLEQFPGPYPLPFERDHTVFERSITADVCKTLDEKSYVVIDNALGEQFCGALRAELQWLAAQNLMQKNQTQFTTPDGPKQFSKPGIFEMDLHHEEVRQRVPEFDALWSSEHLSRTLNAALPELNLGHGVSHQTVKLQWNDGAGGCFPWHYDNPGPPNNRAITCLLYMNPSWKPGDGGELVLQPFLAPAETIAPTMDRLVLFKSDRCLHRVMPTSAERFCCTFWLDSLVANKEEDTLLRERHLNAPLDETIALFRSTALQRVVSRAVYAEMYEESLWECMQGNEGCSDMVKAHEHSLEEISQNPALQELILKFRRWKEEHL